MFSSWTKSSRQRQGSSPGLAARTISFPEQDATPTRTPKRSSFFSRNDVSGSKYSRQSSRDPYRISDGGDREEEEEEESHTPDEDAVDLEDDEDEGSASEAEEETPLLPLFSADILNSLPVFSLTHLFRELVVERCDTVLSWDQLRSPQVSQFLVKPIQSEVKENHMSAATLYALLANALQFNKEAGAQPGNSGTSKTRAMLCELIAIKLLRECSTRELIDALSYNFDPLQGHVPEDVVLPRRPALRAARISCLEIAIHAGAKRFLAHPMVVQHLEAIWNGTIVFHHNADSMHRRNNSSSSVSYGTNGPTSSRQTHGSFKGVSLYNPKDASLFKLSRLRVPRYRNILSTISFAILLLLFMAVLQEKSLEVSTLEVIFWVWAAGYMLDEVLGFNEQGFSLYLASFWNTFDVGILFLLFMHLCLRIYGVILPEDDESKIHVANRAYDVLAASAVLLFPRLFSVLDHYRYFSQLIIAFRMMAADMLAVFVIIIIFCSGFLVALTFAFSKGTKTDDPRDVAYALLQMLMGFTPAAWDRWDEYNWLGKTVLTLFLFICHFVVVTILITVLTNSFMEIVRNANEEHQYLFAINVIANVKSDALFAYVAPFNVLQWLLTPLRYILPFRQYLKVNRTLIKATHLPILWTIYFYERTVLRPRFIDSVDLVESRGRVRNALSKIRPRLIREPSIATFRQEAALEEVFRRPTLQQSARRSRDRRQSSNVVSSWMSQMKGDDDAEVPQEQDRTVVDNLETNRLLARRLGFPQVRDFSVSRRATSVVSDPTDLPSNVDFFSPRVAPSSAVGLTPSAIDLNTQQTDADGDDELQTNDDEDETNTVDFAATKGRGHGASDTSRTDFETRTANHSNTNSSNSNRPRHGRNVSSATMIYNPPIESDHDYPSPLTNIPPRQAFAPSSVESKTSHRSGRKTPKRQLTALKPRPTMPSKENAIFHSTPNMVDSMARAKPTDIPRTSPGKRQSSLEMDLISDIGDNKALGGGYVGALPASFASRMAFATENARQSQTKIRQEEQRRENEEMMGRLMMARMNTLEEGFREVVHEVRESMKQATSGLASRARSPERESIATKRPREKKAKDRLERSTATSGATSLVSKSDAEQVQVEGSSNGRMPKVKIAVPEEDLSREENKKPDQDGQVS